MTTPQISPGSAAALIAKFLKARGVNRVFALCGGHIMPIWMALDAADHPASDIVAFNAGAAIYVAGCAHSIEDGIEAAWDVMESGEALQKLDALAELTQSLAGATP